MEIAVYRSNLALIVVLLGPLQMAGEEIQLMPDKDNMLYESPSGELGNGAGVFLFAGTTGQFSKGIRRSLIRFELEAVPNNSFITGAELSLNVSKAASDESFEFGLYRLSSDWSEGETDASNGFGEGQGIPAVDGDATWLHTNKPDDLWNTPGGDFVATPSDIISIGGEGRYAWGDEGELVADVKFWLSDPRANFGWIVVGDESVPRTAKRFDSRTNPDELARPLLTITFEPDFVPGDCNGDGILDVADLNCACTSPEFSLEQVLAETNLSAADLNGDREVDFADFLVLSSNFNSTGTYTSGDLNCDGTVGFADFLILTSNFGKSQATLATVPEPCIMRVVLTAVLLLPLSRGVPSRNGTRAHYRT